MRDFKTTLNMPQTDFEMKANLAQKEPKIQESWILDGIEKKILNRNKATKKSFILHDGPPYANGSVHVGHALNKVLKDIILRHKGMNGFYAPFVAGWDTHGLPIEQELNKLGINNKPNISDYEKRKNCKNFAIDKIYAQKEQFRRLGLLTEFDEIYLTCDLDFEISQLKIFAKMIDKKLVYQDLKPVYWSWSSQTALADAEIIYKEVESDSVYVAFQLVEGNEFVNKGDNLVIWTTTPWTLPSNLAIAVNPKLEYVKVKADGKNFIVSINSLEKVAEKLGWKTHEIMETFLGKKLEKLKYSHPLYSRKAPIISASYVLDQEGTGLVHNAPGFGHDDYLACKKYGIKVFCPIDGLGKFTAEVKDKKIEKMFYLDANPIIIDELKAKNSLLFHEKIVHSAAHDWRTKKPVFYRATKQWFVDISKIKKNIVAQLKTVKSPHKDIVEKIKEMVINRTEWCISRQRVWGVPIPIIYDKDEAPIMNSKLIKHIIETLDNEGTDIWFEEDAKYFLPDSYSKSKKYIKETDIMDVWFDSGTSYSVLIDKKHGFPADLYLEGKDQFRGWFNSSLITSVAVHNKAPYKMLLKHGFVLDEKGNKMSKSLGNVIDPLKIANQYGADVLRLWVASSDYSDDVRISDNIIQQVAEIYRRIRNTLFRFILGNLEDFSYKMMKKAKLSDADNFVLHGLSENLKLITEAYNNYNFKEVIKIINNHTINLSSWYFDYVKDTLYCESKNNEARIAIQTVFYILIENYLKVLAPIIPHTCEEAYSFFEKKDKEKSVHLETWKLYKHSAKETINLKAWNSFFELKDAVYSELEKARNEKLITKNSQAIITITSVNKLPFEKELLTSYLGVAKIEFTQKTKGADTFKVKNSKYTKCDRCWIYKEKTKVIEQANICNRCAGVIKD